MNCELLIAAVTVNWELLIAMATVFIATSSAVAIATWHISRGQGKTEVAISRVAADVRAFGESLGKVWDKLDGTSCSVHEQRLDKLDEKLEDHEERLRTVEDKRREG